MTELVEWCVGEYLPHRHCLKDDPLLIWGFTIADSITVIEYFFIAWAFSVLANWGVPKGHWRKLNYSVSAIFIFCALNYIFRSITIWTPIYYIELCINFLGTLISFKALYHFYMIGAKKMRVFFEALKITIRNANL
jgi:hypothetical protein